MQTPRIEADNSGERAFHELGLHGEADQIRGEQGGEAGRAAYVLRLMYPVPLNRAYRNYRGVTVLSPEGKVWKALSAWDAKAAGVKPLNGPVCCRMTLHPKLTKSGEASKTRMDLDAIFKLALDALNGIAWQDDKQIVELSARIGEPVIDGGLSVEVSSA
ncbi:MAG: RusA family crossover junction endodeoxyribonuclease [Gallionella sp.]|nr:RusA family crossover junction endodeoxyribonuclease [Gallionella sp.]